MHMTDFLITFHSDAFGEVIKNVLLIIHILGITEIKNQVC